MAVPSLPPDDTKVALRAMLRRRRREVDASSAREAVTALVVSHLTHVRILAGYLADDGEVDPMPILAAARAQGITTALPHLRDRTSSMRFALWSPGAPLETGPFGIRQPGGDAPELAPDCILTPLVGFDRKLGRLGRGGGFYDRAFAALPGAHRIGLAWSVQEVDAVPLDPWDVPLHAVATEKEWIL